MASSSDICNSGLIDFRKKYANVCRVALLRSQINRFKSRLCLVFKVKAWVIVSGAIKITHCFSQCFEILLEEVSTGMLIVILLSYILNS